MSTTPDAFDFAPIQPEHFKNLERRHDTIAGLRRETASLRAENERLTRELNNANRALHTANRHPYRRTPEPTQ